jgi:sorting nexin-29
VVYDVIRKLKLSRAPGDDCTNAELIKNGGKHIWKCIFDLILEIWNKEITSADWKTAVICPIRKKDSKLECNNNYQGVSLLNVTYKIFTNVLTKYIESYTEEFIGEYQCGFRKGRSTTDHIFSLRQIIEKFYEHITQLHQLYVDFKQAFVSISRPYIFEAMKEFGIPTKLINLTKITLSATLNKIKIQNKLS